MTQRGDAELRASLTRLVEAGLLFGRGTPPNATYLFKLSQAPILRPWLAGARSARLATHA